MKFANNYNNIIGWNIIAGDFIMCMTKDAKKLEREHQSETI
jgi:hypothetical protein